MRVVLQRVSRASVTPSRTAQSSIARGIVLLVGFSRDSEGVDFDKAASKLFNCRIFPDEDGKLQSNIKEIEGEILVVPQFTLYAGTARGRRPDFTQAMAPERATQLFDQYTHALLESGRPVVSGVFGANMAVELVNDGPLTLIFEF